MSKDVLTATSFIEAESGERLELNYYIKIINAKKNKVFALRVDKREIDGKLLATESSPAFSDNYERISRLAEFFAKGQVTPGVLTQMCDEWT